MKVTANQMHATALVLPLIAMRGLVVFPDSVNQFDIGRDRSVAAVLHAVEEHTDLFFVAQRSVAVEEPTQDDLYVYGVVGEIQQVFKVSDNFLKVLVKLKYRAKMLSIESSDPFYTASVVRSPVRALRTDEESLAQATVRAVSDQMALYSSHYPKLAPEVMNRVADETNYSALVVYLASNLSFDYEAKQSILECNSTIKRLELLLEVITHENELLKYESELSEKVKTSIDRNQREYFLREQQRVIMDELGEDDLDVESDEYEQKLRALGLPEQSLDKLLKDVSRLRKMQSFSQEATVIRTYLDTVLDLPWNTSTEDKFDVKTAKKMLDEDHYGLEKVKTRIVELLAVRSVTDKINSQIICLVGPPGVGKTSVARSIARCMNRNYVRLSLGGIHDESEIRGHRRTYIGSMPGRIISSLITAKSNNPLILLDEIDKLGSDIKGDPASALLEVLDPEQNFDFKDHFIDIPFDLSKVLFITTANNPTTIPAPLYDRMEIIELTSYTRSEKFNIAKRHLLKKQMEKHGLTHSSFNITDKAIYKIIDDYTSEAGVRSLERSIATICRKAVTKMVSGETETVHITDSDIVSYLEAPVNRCSMASKTNTVGLCNGLAWTAVGGQLLPLEVSAVAGSGTVEMTGMLGDVMKESAKIAFTIARSLASKYGYGADFNKTTDIHIHAPEGAVKKDGPSAGVTLLTSLVSALSGYPVDCTVAMTGEITLHGSVLPIGGLKEKLIAAVKEKIRTVLLPQDNMVDLMEIDPEILAKLKIVPVSMVEDVLELALIKPKNRLILENRQDDIQRTGISN